jgi:hypothetical protein
MPRTNPYKITKKVRNLTPRLDFQFRIGWKSNHPWLDFYEETSEFRFLTLSLPTRQAHHSPTFKELAATEPSLRLALPPGKEKEENKKEVGLHRKNSSFRVLVASACASGQLKFAGRCRLSVLSHAKMTTNFSSDSGWRPAVSPPQLHFTTVL